MRIFRNVLKQIARCRIPVLLLLVLSLAACLTPRRHDWPADLPPRQAFIATWEADSRNQRAQPRDEYLGWVRNFYTGTVVYPQGWLDIQAELLGRAAPDQEARLEAELESLGIAIGAEWAKVNEHRAIDSRLLALWASVLQLAELDCQGLNAVALIANDVEHLLTDSLDKETVREARYTERLGLASFGDF